MSVPATMSTLNFSGVYTHNQSLSDVSSFASMGFPEAVLQALAKSSETGKLTVEHTTAGGIETLVYEYTYTSEADGAQSMRDSLVLGASERTVEFPTGPTAMAAARAAPKDLEDAALAGGWDKDTEEHGVVVIDTRSLGDDKWAHKMAQGFQEADGERHMVRNMVITTADGEKHTARLVFDYQGPAN
ncbi:hypothetical protein PsYK624_145680 [Phanerochaete sordida]|uniref:Uncharacterized protein n=1 Tax=Phanerochaete sordida TaxID=48140 RepID=A0A9P3GRV5_9APHY|nr:hypothetical protein PsYK624_145680 [Phanerochaete sordida]